MYIVIGANGYIGAYLIKNVLQHTEDNVLALSRHIDLSFNNKRLECMKYDITNEIETRELSEKLSKLSNIKIIYLAAYHHPDEVKRNPKLAWDINVTALSRFLNTIDKGNCLFYLSTEMVYGEGTLEKKFSENEELKPINLYGIQKKVAEALVLGYGYNVVRFPFVIGPSLLPTKRHFYDVIVETIRSGKEIEMFEDAYKSALDFDTATNLLVKLVENYTETTPKVLNISGDEIMSKYDIGVRIAKANKLDETLIKPIKLEKDNMIFDEKRADCTILDNSLLKEVLHLHEIKMKFEEEG